jgi:transcriptional regulator with XRE-family HTH domain
MALRGMTLKELGNVTGYSATYLSSIINGRLIVPDETIQKINTALNIT